MTSVFSFVIYGDNDDTMMFGSRSKIRKQQGDHQLDGLLIFLGTEWGPTTDHSEANKRRGNLKLDLEFENYRKALNTEFFGFRIIIRQKE